MINELSFFLYLTLILKYSRNPLNAYLFANSNINVITSIISINSAEIIFYMVKTNSKFSACSLQLFSCPWTWVSCLSPLIGNELRMQDKMLKFYIAGKKKPIF